MYSEAMYQTKPSGHSGPSPTLQRPKTSVSLIRRTHTCSAKPIHHSKGYLLPTYSSINRTALRRQATLPNWMNFAVKLPKKRKKKELVSPTEVSSSTQQSDDSDEGQQPYTCNYAEIPQSRFRKSEILKLRLQDHLESNHEINSRVRTFVQDIDSFNKFRKLTRGEKLLSEGYVHRS